MIDYPRVLSDLTGIVREAGAMVLSAHGAPVHQKAGHFNFVTDTDVAVQEFLRARLSALLPQALFFAEEQENAALTDAPTWVVDPIDGTINFMRGRCCSAVSVGLLANKTPALGVVFDPFRDDMFTAVLGGGAYRNGQPVHVSQTPFERALTSVGTSPYEASLAGATAKCVYQFLTRGGDLRRTGSAARDLCDIACGQADVYFELVLSPWDFAAGSLIVREAGGAFLMPWLEREDFGRPTAILAVNQACRDEALAILLDARRGVE